MTTMRLMIVGEGSDLGQGLPKTSQSLLERLPCRQHADMTKQNTIRIPRRD